MNFLEFALNHQRAGTAVQVTMQGVESDVFLVDDLNLAAFKRRAQFTYFGGHYKRSPVLLGLPKDGNWTVVVIPTGGTVSVKVRTVAPRRRPLAPGALS